MLQEGIFCYVYFNITLPPFPNMAIGNIGWQGGPFISVISVIMTPSIFF